MTKTNEQVCITITRLSKQHPSLSVMQLISNAVPHEVQERLNGDLYYVENDELIGYLLDYEADTLDKGEI